LFEVKCIHSAHSVSGEFVCEIIAGKHIVWGCTTHNFELRVGPGGAIDHIACPCRKTFMLTSVCRIEGLPVSNACKLLM
jgi:hypothetical protein